MKPSRVALAMGALIMVAALLSFPSCGHDKKLVSIAIQPAAFTFGTPNGTEQFTAIGTFIHPPATMDVTSQATWKIDDGVVTMNAGLVSPAPGFCGGGDYLGKSSRGHGWCVEHCNWLCDGDGG